MVTLQMCSNTLFKGTYMHFCLKLHKNILFHLRNGADLELHLRCF